MLCTFCGTENRHEHKFCGMCGVRLERRQVERRARTNGVSMKCTVCNHVNEPGLKFCGMCGTRVERRVQDRRVTADEPRAAAIANAQLPSPDVAGRKLAQAAEAPKRTDADDVVSLPRRGEAAIFRNEPARESGLSEKGSNISGPSFLGLNSQASGGSEYLLEDEPSGGGMRKLILLIIIAAILGLVFVQWRSNLKANPKSVPAKTDPASAPVPTPQADNQPPNAAAASQPSNDVNKTDGTKTAVSGATADPDSVAASEAKDKAEEPVAPAGVDANSSVPAAAAAEVPADKKTKNSAVGGDGKPTDDIRLADYKPSTALVRAQQYLRGRGVPQNCEQGLLYLHAATDKSDPGAAIQMAALYSSGVCVKQDRVMAYRWFNSAHELQPGNMLIQKNMDQLWAQMTSQERRLAGY
jgi:Double zinc ribbon